MGTWSQEIFGNDLAADVRAEYFDRLAASDPAAVAIKQLRRSFAEPLRDINTRQTFWIALAAAQLEAGAVTDDVRAQALKALIWCESPDRDDEAFPFAPHVLAKLRLALGGPPPASAKRPKPKLAAGTPGDVLAVVLPSDGNEAVVYVVGPASRPYPAYNRVVWLFDVAPDSATSQTVLAAVDAWRPYREVWLNGLGRSIGCYDLQGKLPARRIRPLLFGIAPPEAFTRRMQAPGAIHKAADLPWVLEHDRSSWKTSQWTVDPDEAARSPCSRLSRGARASAQRNSRRPQA